jgi:hypothetical protein
VPPLHRRKRTSAHSCKDFTGPVANVGQSQIGVTSLMSLPIRDMSFHLRRARWCRLQSSRNPNR